MTKDFRIDFIGVGAEKTGSSWLFKCLTEHPQICGYKGKEITFFDTTKIIGRPQRELSDYEKYGIEAYKEHFSHCPINSIKGEFTTTYLHDKAVAKRISDNFPDIKILILLRNPVEKSFAQYVAVQEMGIYKNFEDALKKEPEFLRRSHYTEYIEEYFKYFPKENIFIGLYDDLDKEPLQFVQSIYKFLEVDTNFVPPTINRIVDSEEVKILTEFRNRIMKKPIFKAFHDLSRIIKLNILLKKIALIFIKRPEMKSSTRKELLEKFLPDIERLENIIQRDLSAWKK